jgi:hypothetical protein
MKKNILFTLLYIALWAFISFFWYSTYQYYRAIHADDPIDPYLLVDTGSATIVRRELAIDMIVGDRYNLQEKDILITSRDGWATVYWPDRSMTRIGWGSRLIIDRMYVHADYSQIELAYSLENGKVWNTVVRTLYPNSFFEVRLPKNNGTIAWVRGTVFEINLEKNYIHSVDHSVRLTNTIGQAVTLLPGELVEASNILKKLTQDVLDRAWGEYNRVRDQAEILVRNLMTEQTISLLWGDKEYATFWHDIVRSILKYIPGFQDIRVLEDILEASTSISTDVSVDGVMRWYQRFQDTKFVQERENIRALLEQSVQTQSGASRYLETLARSALWDRMSFSGMELKSADTYINTYAKEVDKTLQGVLRVVPASELQNKARETLRSFFQ